MKNLTTKSKKLTVNCYTPVGLPVRNCTNYDIAIPFGGEYNRKTNESHIKNIVEKIEIWGFSGFVQFVRTKAFNDKGKYELRTSDGQHRIAAAKILGIPFNYEVIQLDVDTKENVTNYISSLNTIGLKWSPKDFLKKQVDLKIPEYMFFNKKLVENPELQITDLLFILCGSGATKDFKDGKLKFINKSDAIERLESVKRMLKFLPKTVQPRRAFFKVLKYHKSILKVEKVVTNSGDKLINLSEKSLVIELTKALKNAA